MKTRIRVLISAVLAAPLLLTPVFVLAHEGEDHSGTTGSTPKTVAVETETTQSTSDGTTLQQRLDKRKAELKLKLTALEQTRIQTRCKASQGLISSVGGRVKGVETSRTNVYKNLVDRLTNLDDKLKAKNIDTTQFETEITELKKQIETFKTDLVTYKQAVSDLSAMDCAKDPTAFKASLEAARTARQKVVTDSTNIKKYVTDTIKPTLSQLRAQVEKKESEGTN